MARTILIQLLSEETIMGEIDQLPDRDDQFIILSHPKLRDGQAWPDLEKDVTEVLIPWHRIQKVQLLPYDDNAAVIGFVREK